MWDNTNKIKYLWFIYVLSESSHNSIQIKNSISLFLNLQVVCRHLAYQYMLPAESFLINDTMQIRDMLQTSN